MPVRIATLGDLKAIADLVEFHAYPELNWKHATFSRRATLATAKQFILSPDNEVFLAVKDDQIVGYAFCLISRYFFSEQLFGADLSFYVKPEARGGFLGASMIRKMKRYLKEKGALELFLTINSGVDVDNTVKLSKSLGAENLGSSLSLKIKG
ncbi:GNAT family N-acetyltransferase [Marinomonas algicola]|uniref:GNAT family N-acetyltransferase n=1 Tax=Marinomonas algicola TaxID=2773454 RepID=UPI00174D92E5|nr:GNAT family N-acetyltransferase [Marinomonas algicola]